MKTTLKIKLAPTKEQHHSLLKTMERFNEACNFIAQFAYEKKLASKYKIQEFIYNEVRERFGLSAQMTIRAIAKVVDAYKRDKSKLCKFKLQGAIVYDERIMSFAGIEAVSLWTIDGRQSIAMVFGHYQKLQWAKQKGQADLVLVGNDFYLLATLDIEEEAASNPQEFIGVDLGVILIIKKNIFKEEKGKLFKYF
jgi:putative transposase